MCMQTTALTGATLVLLLTTGVGIVVHELSHAAVLYLFGIQYTVDINPERVGPRRFNAGIFRASVAVTPRAISPETSAWAMRLSSVAPLILAVPFVTVVTGIVPDPLRADSLPLTASTVGWLACAIPSPQDFAVFWHAERAAAEHIPGSSKR